MNRNITFDLSFANKTQLKTAVNILNKYAKNNLPQGVEDKNIHLVFNKKWGDVFLINIDDILLTVGLENKWLVFDDEDGQVYPADSVKAANIIKYYRTIH